MKKIAVFLLVMIAMMAFAIPALAGQSTTCTTDSHVLLAHNGYNSWYGVTHNPDPAYMHFTQVWIRTVDGTCWPVYEDGPNVNGNYWIDGIDGNYMQVHWQVPNPAQVMYMQAVYIYQ